MREGTKKTLSGEGFILLQRNLLVRKFQKVHFQIISQLTNIFLQLEADLCARYVYKILLTLRITDMHSIQWKLFNEVKILFSYSSASSFAPIQFLPLSCKKLCTCKEERFGCTTFQSLWIHYIKLLSSCWQPVAARSPLLCLGPSVALNGVQFWSPISPVLPLNSVSNMWFLWVMKKHCWLSNTREENYWFPSSYMLFEFS